MSDIPQFHPLESGTRPEGLKRFLRLLPQFIERLDPSKPDHLSTVDGLKLGHRIMTYNSTKPWPHAFPLDAAIKLTTHGNPHIRTDADSRAALGAVQTKFRVLERQARTAKDATDPHKKPFWRGPIEVKFASSVFGGKATSARFTLDMRRRGAFRTLGERELPDGSKQKMPAVHTVEIFDQFEQSTGEPEFYVGMLDDVEDLMQRLCAWRDEAIKQAKNIDEYLATVVFFSILGAKVIHPFFDGNGRAFEAQMIKDLHVIGYPVADMPGLFESEVLSQNVLAGISNMFLDQMMQDNKIPYIPKSKLAEVEMHPGLSKAYTRMLSGAIRNLINQGIPKRGDYAHMIASGVTLMKMSLSRQIAEHAARGIEWGPPAASPFAIPKDFYQEHLQMLRDSIAQAGEPVRTRG
jgi:hypothetical protein